MRRFLSTNATAATVLVRLLVGNVFLSEGIQKFLYPAELAAGRFAKIGIPAPKIMGRSLVRAKLFVARC
jgi:putative oxidoreductase